MSVTKLLLMLLVLFGGLHMANAYYDPGTQRWLNRDPIGEPAFELVRIGKLLKNNHLNLYVFVMNDPVLRIDPLGLISETPTPCKAKLPDFPELSPDCANDPGIKRAYNALITCAQGADDGCPDICECLAQNGGPSVNVCLDRCINAYRKRCL